MLGPILLVEDNEDDVFFMKRALKGAEVTNPLQVVTDGQQAIDYMLGSGKYSDRTQFPLPCMVLLDLKLPHKSGHEVLQWIREHVLLKQLVVIILTTSRETRDVERAYNLGANAFLVKPPGSVQLTEMIRGLKHFWFGHNTFAALVNS